MKAFLKNVTQTKLRMLLALWGILFFAGCQPTPDIETSLSEQAAAINTMLTETRTSLTELQKNSAAFYSRLETHTPAAPLPDYYKFYEDVVFYKAVDDGLCGMWASGLTPISSAQLKEIHLLTTLQPAIKYVANSSKLIELSYILTRDHIAFFYPFFEGISFFEPKTDFYKAYKPFFLLTPENNPERKTLWITPYIDAAGNGYVSSVAAPVYLEDTFMASVGVDISLKHLGEAYLLPNRMQMLLTGDSLLTYAPQALSQETQIETLNPYYYTDSIKKDKYVPNKFKLTNNPSPEIRKLAEQALSLDSFETTISGRSYTVYSKLIPESGWRLVELVRQ